MAFFARWRDRRVDRRLPVWESRLGREAVVWQQTAVVEYASGAVAALFFAAFFVADGHGPLATVAVILTFASLVPMAFGAASFRRAKKAVANKYRLGHGAARSLGPRVLSTPAAFDIWLADAQRRSPD